MMIMIIIIIIRLLVVIMQHPDNGAGNTNRSLSFDKFEVIHS
jgi:hypothetical protein